MDQALVCLQKDKIQKPLKYDVKGIPRCLLLRSRLMIMSKEPLLALDDIKQVLVEKPENVSAICTQVG